MDAGDKRFRILAACVIAALLAVALVNLVRAHNAKPATTTLSYSEFLDEVAAGKVLSVHLSGHRIAGQKDDAKLFDTIAADDPDLVRTLRQKGVAITAEEPPSQAPSWSSLAGVMLALVLLLGLGLFFMRQRVRDGGGSGSARSKAKRLSRSQVRVTFADVAGIDEATGSLQEIVDFLREPRKFQRLGGRIPRGVLLSGPPGAGKTLLARAIAGEAQVPFFTISGSDFVEMFVGVGASRVRDLFDQARKSAPCIVFVDEIDAVGRRRGAGLAGGGSDEREQTLNQLLVEMDGFESSASVILIAATNRPDVLDPALLRPGRFDRRIVVDNPDVVGRQHILGVHVRKVPLAADVDLAIVARGTAGFSGADLMNLVNEAALLAARRARTSVGLQEFEDAKDTVTLGVERRTHVMSASEKRLIAYREAGRATVALHAPSADPLHKVTIVTRGRATGMVAQRSDDASPSISREQLTSRLAILMAGRATEQLVFGSENLTTGTALDIEQATRLARRMVTRYGLSEALGSVAYGDDQGELLAASSPPCGLSEELARTIESEVRRLIDSALSDARWILDEHRKDLEALTQSLLLHETLTGEQVRSLST